MFVVWDLPAVDSLSGQSHAPYRLLKYIAMKGGYNSSIHTKFLSYKLASTASVPTFELRVLLNAWL